MKKKFFVVIFLARVLFISKMSLHIVRKKIKKESWQLVERQKSYSKSKNVEKCPKHSKFLV